jgi:hypothetical protein
MAQRKPDLRSVIAMDRLVPEAGKVLRWGNDGKPQNVRLQLADLGIWIGRAAPPVGASITYDQWANGVAGYYAWIDLSALPTTDALVTAASAALALTCPAPSLRVLDPLALAAPAAAMALSAVAPGVNAIGSSLQLTAPAAALLLSAAVPAVSALAARSAPAASLAMSAVVPGVVALGGGGEGALFFDPFTSDSSASYTIEGDGGAAPFAISGGKLRRNVGDYPTAVWLRAGHAPADGVLKARVALDATALGNGGTACKVGVVARYVSAGASQLDLYLTPTGLLLVQRAASVWSTKGSYLFTPAEDTEYEIEISFVGTALTVKLDGTERITATTTITAAGGVGAVDSRDDVDESPASGTTTLDDLTLSGA